MRTSASSRRTPFPTRDGQADEAQPAPAGARQQANHAGHGRLAAHRILLRGLGRWDGHWRRNNLRRALHRLTGGCSPPRNLMMLNEQMGLLYPMVAVLLLMAVFVLYLYFTSDRHFPHQAAAGPGAARCLRVHRSRRRRQAGLCLADPSPRLVPVHRPQDGRRRGPEAPDRRAPAVATASRQGRALQRIPWTKQMESVPDQAGRMKEGPRVARSSSTGRAAAREAAAIPSTRRPASCPRTRPPKAPPSGIPRRAPQPRTATPHARDLVV
ncbi:MAG: hypothetical protein JWQ76_2449 [Ramlibacter sp.]|nr:hypothetical protein [Ramlibacter sp.]